MQTIPLQKAIEQAKANPTSDFSKNLRNMIDSGELDQAAQKQGVDLSKFGRPTQRTTTEKIADFTGGKELSQGLGQVLAQKGTQKLIDETQKQQFDLQGKLVEQIKTAKEQGRDTTRLENALNLLNEDVQEFGAGAEKLLNPNELTNKEVIGDALQLATTAGGAKVAGAVAGKATQAATAGQGFIQGAKAGLAGGAVTGALTGTSQGLQENKDAEGIAKDALTGAAIGGVGGAVLGGAVGAIGGGLTGSKLRQEALTKQRELGIKPAQDVEALKTRANIQGFEEPDVDFITSMKPADRAVAQKQIELAEKALKDKRSLQRPIDLVGEKFVAKAKNIEKLNKEIGKNVDEVAKTLKGKPVDVTSMRQNVISKLEDANVSILDDGTLDFSQSVFKNTPKIQKEIQKVISTIPDGGDAYQVHIFKKTLDEMVEYGVSGEGLKGNSKNILKALRAYADDALDTTFDDYNKVNTDFRNTKEVLERAKELFGKKNGFSKERGGGLLRAIFSNRESRGRLLALLDEVDTVGAKYGVGTNDNLIDQALFTEILEETYGTQATTSLQGQVKRAVQGTKKTIQGIRNPIEGAGELLASGVESILGISDENKRKLLLELLR